MKKIASLLAVVTLFALLSVPSLADSTVTEQSNPPSGTVTLEANIADEFTVTIPSGAKTIQIIQGATSDLGSVQFTAGHIASDEVVTITAQKDALRLNGTSTAYYADYSLSGNGSWRFATPGAAAASVTATVTDVSHALVAGNYSDVITFTVSVDPSV